MNRSATPAPLHPCLLQAIVSARRWGYHIDDPGRSGCRANGVETGLPSDRDNGLDAGFRSALDARLGAISPQAVYELADAGDCRQRAPDDRKAWLSDRISLTADVGTSKSSLGLAHSYVRSLDEQIARGVTADATGPVDVSNMGMTTMRSLGPTRRRSRGAVESQLLRKQIRHNPLLESDVPGDTRDCRQGSGRVVLALGSRC